MVVLSAGLLAGTPQEALLLAAQRLTTGDFDQPGTPNKTMRRQSNWIQRKALHVVLLTGSILVFAAVVQCRQEPTTPTVENFDKSQTPTASPASRPSSKVSPYHSTGASNRQRNHYQVTWGVDSFEVKSVESGQMIRFSYRVIDAEKAKGVNDKKATPYLIDEKARVKLVVPSMEKVGQLRQSSTPEPGKSYWMVFSNKGAFVKRGNRVSVVIGRFRVDGLTVQ